MVEYLEPVAMKFIIVTAAIATIVVITDIVLIMRRKGTARLEGLLPAVDSVLVIAGFMAFTGTGIALIQSAGKIADCNSLMEPVLTEITQRWTVAITGSGWTFAFNVLVTALTTVIIVWALFFIFFEVWLLLRLLYRRYMKKVTVLS